MKEIFLNNGKIALVDDTDYDYLNQWKWIAVNPRSDTWYARRTENKRVIYMHRFIMGDPRDGTEVDHWNGNGLLNTRENLRLVTRSQNAMNRKIPANNVTGFKGVKPPNDKCGVRNFQARICVKGDRISLGMFKTSELAARAYDAAAKKYFGKFARTNFND